MLGRSEVREAGGSGMVGNRLKRHRLHGGAEYSVLEGPCEL